MLMKDIVFYAAYGDEKKKVVLSEPSGAGGQIFLTIDNFHRGTFTEMRGEWRHYSNKSELTIDDIQILVEMIKNKKSAL
ncbi:hypothetical protein PV783_11695 [Chitinophaga sp. CC14]|uniref:hypothetical protein n=1 Tax=Chitinophaga sp. CC14 TaxID=3029199 RepID=UPI003B8143EF